MRDDDPQSSFQSPENYREYAKDAYRALERYQKIRRPLMFHVLLWTIIFKPPHFYWSFYLVHTIAEATGQFPQFIFNSHSWYIINLISTFIISLLALGIVNCFRHLEDGFQAKETDKPIFTLKTRFRFTGSAIKEVFVPPVDNYFKGLKWEWFWRTWFFYPAVVTGLLGLFNLFRNGFSFFMDLFFLKCWDEWLARMEELKMKTGLRKYLRGIRLRKLPQSSGSSA